MGKWIMKIGEFCRQFGVTASTVRYYVKEGLLVPDERNMQFVFTRACVTDMELIQQLKEYQFTLAEIHETLSLYRISAFAAPEDRRRLKILLYRKRAELEEGLAKKEQALLLLNHLAEKGGVGEKYHPGNETEPMNIHEFSREYDVPLRTLRYYVDQKLLCPQKSGAILQFDEGCRSDLFKIRQLKQCEFTLHEIGEWLDKERLPVGGEEKSGSWKRKLAEKKREQVAAELEALKGAVKKLEDRIYSLQERPAGEEGGFDLAFLPLLCCPSCQKPLEFYEMHMKRNQVVSGTGRCTCGYCLAIENGVVNVPGDSAASGTIINPTDYNRETYNRMAPSEVSGFQKAFNWVLNQVRREPLEGRVVFENSVDVVSFLSTGIGQMDEDALYVIADSDYNVICDIQKRIRTGKPEARVLYLASPSLAYPLVHQSIDVLIDFYNSEVLQASNIVSLTDAMALYMKPGAIVAGVYTHIIKGRGTLSKNRKMYPESYPGRYQLQSFKNSMARNRVVMEEESVVNTFDYTASILSFEKGDIMGDYAFVGKMSEYGRRTK